MRDLARPRAAGAGGELGEQLEHVGVDDEPRVLRIVGRGQQVDVVDQRRLGPPQHAELVVDHLVVGRVLDVRDRGLVELAELRGEPPVGRDVDRVGPDVGEVAQAVAQVLLRAGVSTNRYRNSARSTRDQRADPEERDRDLATQPHGPPRDPITAVDRTRAPAPPERAPARGPAGVGFACERGAGWIGCAPTTTSLGV